MLTQMRTLLAPPRFAADDAKTRAASIIYPLLLLILVAYSAYGVLDLVVPTMIISRQIIVLPAMLATLALLILVRRGHVWLASLALALILWLVASSAMLLGGGVQSPALAGLVLVVISAGLLLSWSAAIRFAILSAITAAALWYATIAGGLPVPYFSHTPTSILATHMLVLLITTVLVSRTRRSTDTALEQADRELAERRRVEAALRSSEARYRALVSSFPNGAVLLFDQSLRYTLAEGAGLADVGLSKGQLEGRTIDEVFEPAVRAAVEPVYRAALGGATSSVDMPFRGRIYRVHTLPITDANGAITGGMAMTQDITADKRAEIALKESEERYARLADATFEGISLCENNIIFDANERLAAMLGYSRDQLIGLASEELIAPESRDLVRRRVAAGYQGLYEHLALRKDGSVFPVEVRSRPLRYQGRAIRVTVVRDISARVAVQMALAQSELRFRSAFHANPTPQILTHAVDGTFLDVNTAYERLVGYSHEELLGKRTTDTGLWVDLDRAELMAELAANGRLRERPTQVRDKAGRVHDLILSIEPVQQHEAPCLLCVMIDVTERLAAMAALERSERMFKDLVQSISAVVWAADAQTFQFSFVSEQAEKILGYPTAEWLARSSFWADHIHPDDRNQAVDYCVSSTLAHQNHEITYRMIAADGRVVWLRDLVTVEVVDAAPRTLRGVMVDITAQKQAEAALMASEDRYRSVVAALAEGIMLFDAAGQPQTWNASAEHILGLGADQLGAMTSDDPRWRLFNEDGTRFRRSRNPLLTTLRTGQPCVDVPMGVERLDGARIWLSISTQPIRAPGAAAPSAVVVSFTDITAHKRAKAALADQEMRLRAIFDHAAIGIALVDMQGCPIESNPALGAMLGYSAEELHAMAFAQFTHPDDVDADVQLFGELIAGAREFYALQKRYIRKDGQVVWGHLRVSLIRDSAGAPQFAIGMVEDITERKRIEQQYLQAQKMDSIGRLAGGIAHDFNNLLTVILGNTGMLLEELEPSHPLYRDVAQIGEAADRAAALTRQLLTFSRKQVLVPRVIDLNTVVAGIAPLLQRLIGEHITLISRCAPDLGQVMADPGQMEQVIVNLAVNARDAMETGGTLIIETANALRDAPAAGNYVLLAVSDTGVGIDAQTRERIFEPFFTTKAAGKGTGLGLATVYGIVTQSGGHIWVYSEVGQGSTFKVYLPRCDAPEPPATEGAAETGVGGAPAGATILLVEDDTGVRELVSRMLGERGYHVCAATDAQEALNLAGSLASIDLLLTDVIMPGGTNGVTLAARLQAARPALRVLYMSGYTSTALTNQAMLPAGQALIMKPFTPDELARAVWEALAPIGQQPAELQALGR